MRPISLTVSSGLGGIQKFPQPEGAVSGDGHRGPDGLDQVQLLPRLRKAGRGKKMDFLVCFGKVGPNKLKDQRAKLSQM